MTTLKNKSYDLSGDVEKLKECLLEASRDVKGKAGAILADSFETAREQSTQLKNNVSEYVVEKPLKSLGITLLLGILIGYLLHR